MSKVTVSLEIGL